MTTITAQEAQQLTQDRIRQEQAELAEAIAPAIALIDEQVRRAAQGTPPVYCVTSDLMLPGIRSPKHAQALVEHFRRLGFKVTVRSSFIDLDWTPPPTRRELPNEPGVYALREGRAP